MKPHQAASRLGDLLLRGELVAARSAGMRASQMKVTARQEPCLFRVPSVAKIHCLPSPTFATQSDFQLFLKAGL